MAATLEVSRARRASVVELERLLRIGRSVMAGFAPSAAARRYMMSEGQIMEAARLAEAESRGCMDTSQPMTLEEARIAAGIE